MLPRFPFEDPQAAVVAWKRYFRLMRFMMLATVSAVAIAMIVLYRSNGMVSVHFYIATALGISFAMLLMSALMGLVFLSSAAGHDAAVTGPEEGDPQSPDSDRDPPGAA